jgi:hypothetical protein
MTASVVFTTPLSPESDWLPVTVYLEDQATDPVILSSILELQPYTSHMPLIFWNRP